MIDIDCNLVVFVETRHRNMLCTHAFKKLKVLMVGLIKERQACKLFIVME